MPPFFLCNRHYEGDDGDDGPSVPAESVQSHISRCEGAAVRVTSVNADSSTIGVHDSAGEHCGGVIRD